MRAIKPSEKQLALLQFVDTYSGEYGRPPTLDEMRTALRLNSKSSVAYHLRVLETSGLLERTPHVSRGIRRPADGSPQTFQLAIKGWIRAGAPVMSGEIDEAVSLTGDVCRPGGELYGLRVLGDSMRDAMISDGDIVVLQRQDTAANGDMVAVHLTDRNEFTLKRYFRESGRVRLRPANAAFRDIVVKPGAVEIQGRVVAVIRQY